MPTAALPDAECGTARSASLGGDRGQCWAVFALSPSFSGPSLRAAVTADRLATLSCRRNVHHGGGTLRELRRAIIWHAAGAGCRAVHHCIEPPGVFAAATFATTPASSVTSVPSGGRWLAESGDACRACRVDVQTGDLCPPTLRCWATAGQGLETPPVITARADLSCMGDSTRRKTADFSACRSQPNCQRFKAPGGTNRNIPGGTIERQCASIRSLRPSVADTRLPAGPLPHPSGIRARHLGQPRASPIPALRCPIAAGHCPCPSTTSFPVAAGPPPLGPLRYPCPRIPGPAPATQSLSGSRDRRFLPAGFGDMESISDPPLPGCHPFPGDRLRRMRADRAAVAADLMRRPVARPARPSTPGMRAGTTQPPVTRAQPEIALGGGSPGGLQRAWIPISRTHAGPAMAVCRSDASASAMPPPTGARITPTGALAGHGA